MYISIKYKNEIKNIKIKKNISCYHLKKILKNYFVINHEFYLVFNNKILENNKIINNQKTLIIKEKINGGSVLINPGNSIFITLILVIIFTISGYIYHNFYLNGLTIGTIKTNTEEKNLSLETQNISKIFEFTPNNLFSNGRIKYFEQSEYNNSENKITSKGVCPKKHFGDNSFYEIKKGDSSILGRLTFGIFMCFYFLSFFTFVFSIMSKSRCKKPSTGLICISIIMMIIPLLLVYAIPVMDNIFVGLMRLIKRFVDWFYRKILKKDKGPLKDFLPKEIRNYSLMIGNIILIIMSLFLYFSHIKVISPIIILILGILFFFCFFIIRNETLTNIISKIVLVISKVLRPGFDIREEFRDCYSLYRILFSFFIICFLLVIVYALVFLFYNFQVNYVCKTDLF